MEPVNGVEKIAGTWDEGGSGIAIDSNDNVYIIGGFASSTLNFSNGKKLSNHGNSDTFLAKFNNLGICLWAESISGTGSDEGGCITLVNNDIYLSAYFQSSTLNFNNGKFLTNSGNYDVFLAKYDSSGSCLNVEKIAGSQSDISTSMTSKNSNLYLIGSFASSVLNFNNNISLNLSSGMDAFLVKYKAFSIEIQTLFTPRNNAINVAKNSTLYWSKVLNATNYRLQVSISNNFSNLVVNQIISDTNFTLNNLNYNTIYYWRVLSMNSTDTSSYSDIWQFTTSKTEINLPNYVPKEGLVGWWPFNGNSNDESGYGNNGIVHGATLTNDRFYSNGKAYNFDGMNDFINFSSNSDFRITTDISVSVWVKPLKSFDQYIIWFGDLSQHKDPFGIAISGDNKFLFRRDVGNGDIIQRVYSKTLKDTSFIHIVGTYNSTNNRMYIYINGILEDSISNVNSIQYSTDNMFLNFGAVDDGQAYFFKGIIDDIGIWNRALSPIEIDKLFNSNEPIPNPWAFTDFTGSNSTVLVPKNINPKIDTRDFQKGDAVGFFFTRNGALVCAGYGVWNNVNLAVTVWGDDSETVQKDGFATNEGYTIKIWDGQLGKEMNSEFTVASGNAYFTNNGYSILATLKGVSTTTHAIYLKNGWNLMSSYVIPANDSMENVWNALDEKLIIAKNNGRQVYIPSYEINSIGKWKYKEAYQTYMSSADTLKVSGLAANPSNENIVINNGWNLVSYLLSSAKDISECLTTLTESSSLVIAKNNAGQVYIPSYDINSIGNMLPGQGYQMYLTAKDTLVYPANGAGRTAPSDITPMAKYILPEYSETGNSAVLLLEIEGNNGDEIAVYNHNNQVIGSGVIHKNKAAVTIWGDNERTNEIDGAILSEKLKVKSYNVNTGRIIDVNLWDLVDVVTGNNVNELNYTKDAFLVAKAKVMDNNSNLSMLVNPNPASDYIEITIEGESENSTLMIITNNGKQIADLTSEILTLSGNKLRYNTTNLSSGTYNVILNNGKDKIIIQIMIVK